MVTSSVLTCACAIDSPQTHPCWQKERFTRRHSATLLRFFSEPEEGMLSARCKRVTMDFSLLSIPSVSENVPPPAISLQVQNNERSPFPSYLLLHSPAKSVPPGSERASEIVRESVCVCCACSRPFLC